MVLHQQSTEKFQLHRLWDVADMVALVEAREAPPKKRGPYNKRASDAAELE